MILLSFDIEEFDMPFEYGVQIPFEEQMTISIQGTKHILDLLSKHQIKATFFTTATFAMNAPDIVKRIVADGHEIASHGYYHSKFSREDYLNSKLKLEEISGNKISGFRMARMQPVDNEALIEAGYVYNSSINPTYLPGRYNNLHISRTWFKENNLIQLPASVSPMFRFPLFWLSFHNLPLSIYTYLSKRTLKKDGYLNIYFHPWEFINLKPNSKYNFPSYVTRKTGEDMIKSLDDFIKKMSSSNASFGTIQTFLNKIK